MKENIRTSPLGANLQKIIPFFLWVFEIRIAFFFTYT